MPMLRHAYKIWGLRSGVHRFGILRPLHLQNIEKMSEGIKLPKRSIDLRAQMIILHLATMSKDERIEIMAAIVEFFCPKCWRELQHGERCHCWNDE